MLDLSIYEIENLAEKYTDEAPPFTNRVYTCSRSILTDGWYTIFAGQSDTQLRVRCMRYGLGTVVRRGEIFDPGGAEALAYNRTCSV